MEIFLNMSSFTMSTLYAILLSLVLLNHTFCTDALRKSPIEWENQKQWILGIGLITLVISVFSFILYSLTYSVLLSFFLISFNTFSIKIILPLLLFVVTHIISLQITRKCIQKTPSVLSQILRSFLPLLFIQSTLLTATFIYLTHTASDFLAVAQQVIGVIAGFTVILIIFEKIAERLETTEVSAALKGTAIHLLTIGILSLALVGLSGTLLL